MSLSGLCRVTESLFLSNAASASTQSLLRNHHITCVINVSLQCSTCSLPDLEYLHFSVADTPDTSLSDYFETMTDKVHKVEASGGCTLIHCSAGISRSPTLCLAYLMRYRGLSLLAAHVHLKTCRPIIRPNLGFWRQLITYELDLFGKNTVHIINSPVGLIPSIYEAEIRNMIPF
ncbi:dual specificity protein phosphatase 18 [Pseudophryne corroboree]|uniref:dual specificity protein phosphatase 18 n=1 Tax=Pseudophryne corroboree TaxID=495146 RepID=UPI0030817315